MKNIASSTRIYLYLMFFVILLIILSPLFGGSLLPFVKKEFAEIILICFLFVLAYWTRLLYKKELEKNTEEFDRLMHDQGDLERRLDDAFKYIGKVNVQMQEIRGVFSAFEKYPQSKRDVDFIFKYFAAKILGLVDFDWVFLRIVDLSNSQTLKEFFLSRGGSKEKKPEIANKIILENKTSPEWQATGTDPTNIDIKAFCIFPRKELNQDQEILIKGFISRLEMLFVIFYNSYKKR